ncbi:MAG TPA: NAD(P)/FAD-dependent oxidoreductase [Thermomicrobiales bacterium]|nr:NAD(P)/FAD-dependent oxidoreductase [Thermomicrobiales bacterium]
MADEFDALVVGARIAGSAMALHLAARGWRVLLLDAATFPSDTLSTHLLWSDALRAFDRLGVLPEVLATGAPPLGRVRLVFGDRRNEAPIPAPAGYPPLLSVRRLVLDDILVRRARRAPGVTVREGFAVDDLLRDGDRVVGVRGHARGGRRAPETLRAGVVIGADGRHSTVARLVGAAEYDVVPPLLATYYAYYRGVAPPAMPALEAYRDERGGFAYLFPCDAGFWTLAVSFPQAEFAAARRDLERQIAAQVARKSDLPGRLAGATRATPLRGAGDLVNFFRAPGGPGWALVGDAGYHRDPITARGISDALHEAELLAAALNRARRGETAPAAALADYQARRDALVRPLYDFTCDRPPAGVDPAAWSRYLGRVLADAPHLSAYLGFMAGAVPAEDFYSAAAVAEL